MWGAMCKEKKNSRHFNESWGLTLVSDWWLSSASSSRIVIDDFLLQNCFNIFMRMIEITNVVKFYNRIKNDTRIKRWKKFEYVIRKFGEGGKKPQLYVLLPWTHITIQSKATITLLLITRPNDNWPNSTQRWPLRERSIMNARPGSLRIIKLFAINSFPSSIHFVLRKFHSGGAHRKQEIAKRLQRANALSVSYAFTLVNGQACLI